MTRDFITSALLSVQHVTAHRSRHGASKERKAPRQVELPDTSTHTRTGGPTVQLCGDSIVAETWIIGHCAIGQKYKGKCVIFRKRCIRGGMKRLRILSPRWTSWTTDLPGSVGVSLVLRHSPRDCCFGHDFRCHAKVVATFFATQSAKERTRCCVHLCCTRS